MADDASKGEAAPETATAPQTAPAPEQTAQEAAPETQDEFNPDSLPALERDRLRKWADRHAESFHRDQLHKLGNDLQRLPPEDRKRLRENPHLLREYEARISELQRLAGGQAGVQPQTRQPETKTSDGLEQEAEAILLEQGITPETTDVYDKLKKLELTRLRKIESRISKLIESREEALVSKASEKLTEKDLRQQDQDARASEEWNHSDPIKSAAFEGAYYRAFQRAQQEGRKITPKQAYDEAKKIVFPVSVAAPSKPKQSFGDKSNGKVGASAGTDPLESFIQENRAKGIDLDNARWG